MNGQNMVRLIFAVITVAVLSFTACKSSDKSAQQPVNKDSTAAMAAIDSSSVPTVLTDTTHVMLRFRVHPGDVYYFHESVHSVAKGTFNKTPSQSEELSNYFFSLKIARVLPDSSIQAFMTYDTIVVRLQTDKNVRSFNSSDSNQMHDPQYLIYSTMIHTPVLITVSNSGDITKVDSLGAIVDKIIAASPRKDSVPPEVRGQLEGQIADAAVKSIVQHVFSHFGSVPVAPHGTWESRFTSMADVFPTENVITYTLTDLSNLGPMRTAVFASDLKVKVMQNRIDDSSATIKFRGGSFTGIAKTQVDLVHGIAIRKSARMEITLSVAANGKGQYSANVGDIRKTTTRETLLERL